jgi:hypothetical protein
MRFEQRRVLVYCKTYPELSDKHRETVCTAGVTVPEGRPVRLFPVPLRYLPQAFRYQLYDVFDVPLARSERDPRPETHVPQMDGLRKIDNIKSDGNWIARREVIFRDTSWHFACLEHLKERQAVSNHSLGIVPVACIEELCVEDRPETERVKHERKLAANRAKIDMFEKDDVLHLDFLPHRVWVRWRCGVGGRVAPGCRGHGAHILDWGLLELCRKHGPRACLTKAQEITDVGRKDVHFFVGNFFRHPQSFGVIGVWWPPRVQQLALSLGS